ncbi:MAG: molybdopterin-dependent oxidoreductase [Aggregatilineales bacterium]
MSETIQETKKPGLLTGLLVGAILTPALIALFFLGERFAGLPFIPLDLFDWFARNAPGEFLTLGIDAMIDILIALGFGQDLDSTAKMAERGMALGMFWLTGVLFASLFFAAANRLNVKNVIPGLIGGLMYGAPFILMSFAVNIGATAGDALSLVWLVLVFSGFGLVIGWIYSELSATAQPAAKEKTAAATGMDRRQFLVRAGGASATLTVVGAGLGAMLGVSDPDNVAAPINTASIDPNVLPNAGDPVSPAPGTRLEVTPIRNHYRIDTVSGTLPSYDEADYVLPITGLVANEVEWTLDDIREMPSMTEYLTMGCISNRVGGSLIGTTKWTGVSFQHILEQIDPDENAKALRITGAGGFDEYVEIEQIREDERIMLCYAWDDEPLPQRNGFPLRTHIPNRFGMKQPKWIESIEVIEEWQEGYWVRRSWSRDALVRATAVIDSVSDDATFKGDDGKFYVPVGGIAWAGDRGISKVELSFDNGEWVEAELRAPISDRTWVIWRYDWEFDEGGHTVKVRCEEGDGTPQIEEKNPVRPDGATGYNSRIESVNMPDQSSEADSEATAEA